MWQRLKRSFRTFAASPPGRRFQDSYRRHRREGRGPLRLVLVGLIAVVLLAVGLLGLVVPGPGTLFIAAAAAVVARESLPFSKFLDRVELKLRPLGLWLRRQWRAVRGKRARRHA